jgi:hypothetical protein
MSSMDAAELRQEIIRLEMHIERLAQTIERCRKIGFAARIGAALSLVFLSAALLGAIRADPAAVIAALAGVVGGIVLIGANRSTAAQTAGALRRAEAERAELIGRIPLQVAGSGEAGEVVPRGGGGILP